MLGATTHRRCESARQGLWRKVINRLVSVWVFHPTLSGFHRDVETLCDVWLRKSRKLRRSCVKGNSFLYWKSCKKQLFVVLREPWGPRLGIVVWFLGSELAEEGPTPWAEFRVAFLPWMFSWIQNWTKKVSPLRWAEELAWICMSSFEFCDLCVLRFSLESKKVPSCSLSLRFVFGHTYMVSRGQAVFGTPESETAGATAACCFKGIRVALGVADWLTLFHSRSSVAMDARELQDLLKKASGAGIL